MRRHRLSKRVTGPHFLLRALLVFALLAIAFGHQPLDLGTPTSGDVAAYELPDGSLPVICFGDGSASYKGNGKGHAFSAGCDACRLTASVAMPAPPCLGARERVAAEHGAPVAAVNVAVVQAFPPAAPPTAPPLA